MAPPPTPNDRLLLLVDGHSLAFRAYYAFAKSREGGLRTSSGIPTSVCYGFMRTLVDVVTAERPGSLAVAFDLPTPTFRHEADPRYKANRAETPDDFIPDVVNLQGLLEALNLPIVTSPGYEADDVLGTLATQGKAAGYRVKILTGDRDLFQLVTRDWSGTGISILYMSTMYGRGYKGGGTEEYGPEQVIAKLGVPPEQVVDYKALCGDTSDNIPGVKGIGPKTAVQLLTEYGSLDRLYDELANLKPTVRSKLEAFRDEAYLSQRLSRIIVDVPLERSLADLKLRGFQSGAVLEAFDRLELREFVRNVDQLQVALGGRPEAEQRQAPGEEEEGDPDFWTWEETRAYQEKLKATQLQPWVLESLADVQILVQHLQLHRDPRKPVAWDTETTDLDPDRAALVGIGCCWGTAKNEMAYLPLGHEVGHNLPLAETLNLLRPILESDRYPKVFQNTKFDRLILRHQGVDIQGVVFDTLLASYLLDPEADHDLGSLADRYLKLIPKSYTDLVPKGKTIATVSIPDVAQYCGMDVHVTYRLVGIFQEQLEQLPALQELLARVELPLELVLANMEDQGVCIDVNYLQNFSQQLEQDLHAIETKAYEAAGQTFNLASPKQLGELLFETLGLNKRKSRKMKTGYSTDAVVLERLKGEHPVVDLLLEHRTLAKLKSTYVDALPALVRSSTGRVHTDFNQAVTVTGRLSSSNPNLQNIPIRTAFSRQIRQAFISKPGWQILAADYSQIELRILAHLSQEPVLLEAYRTGQDVHRLTAQLLLEKEEITPEERRLGKVINFGVIYGMGAQRFARETGVSVGDAKLFLQRFHDRYAQVFHYLQRMEKEAIVNGYVQTILGRRRYFQFSSDRLRKLRGTDPDSLDLASLKSLGQADAGLLRAAANAPIQGSSADIIKVAMVNIHQLLQPYQTHLILQVHDELVFEIPPAEIEQLQPQIHEKMISAVVLQVPLGVDIHIGQNWMDAKG
jgi:DNA polymerase I